MENEPTKQISTFPKSGWKIWLWGVILFIAVFIVIKEASKFTENSSNKIDKKKAAAWPKLIISESTSDDTHFYDDVDIILPSFPKGEKAFASYIQQSVHVDAQTKGRVIVSFVVSKTGELTDIKILRGINEKTDQEVVKALKKVQDGSLGKRKLLTKQLMWLLLCL